MAKNELHIFKYFFTLQFWQKIKLKILINLTHWVSIFRLSRWLCQGNVLFFDLIQHVALLFCSGHWQNYFLQLGHAVWASVQSIFLRYLWFQNCQCFCPKSFANVNTALFSFFHCASDGGDKCYKTFFGVFFVFVCQ